MRLASLLMLLVSSSAAWSAETMRIAVGPEASTVAVEGRSLRWAQDAEDATFLEVGLDRLSIGVTDEKLTVAGQALPVSAIRLRAAQGSALTVNQVRVQGDVVVVLGKKGLVAVNVLPLEEYLVGVLGSEMPKSFPLEALKAQAIAARTYALNKKLAQYGQPFHLGSSVISQVYKGLDAEDPRTREAVEATRGQVLTYQLQPIEAYFHASCGGTTESGLDALGRELPYLQSVSCPCGSLETSHWSLAVPSSALKSFTSERVSQVEVPARTPTGRARKVQVGTRTVDAVTFRERLGYMKVKSLHFDVLKAKDGWRLEGVGFGHGAGLCQWGARVLAERGWSAERIVAHYYPGAELQTLY